MEGMEEQTENIIENDATKSDKLNKITQPNLKVWSEDIEVTETKTIKRLTFRGLLVDIAEVINLDKGLLYTLKGMTIRPTQTIREYLDDKRHIVTNPIKFFILIVGTTLLIATQTGYFDDVSRLKEGFEFGYSQGGDKEIPTEVKELEENMIYYYENYFVKYQNIWFLITIVFTSFFTYLFFRKRGFNLVEHNIINTYVFVYTYLFFTLMVVFNLRADYWSLIYMGVYTLMSIIVYKQLFVISWWKSIYKTLLAFISSLLLFYLLFAIAGFVWAIQNVKG